MTYDHIEIKHFDRESFGVDRKEDMLVYSIMATGENMKDTMKEWVMKGREIGHPIGKATKFQIVPLPEAFRGRKYKFINEFMELKGEEDKIYIMVDAMDADIRKQHEANTKTGEYKVRNKTAKGTKKWETKYVMYYDKTVTDEDGNEHLLPIEVSAFDTKTEAMEIIKEQSKKLDQELYVKLEKRLTNADEIVAYTEALYSNEVTFSYYKGNLMTFFGKTSLAKMEEEQENEKQAS